MGEVAKHLPTVFSVELMGNWPPRMHPAARPLTIGVLAGLREPAINSAKHVMVCSLAKSTQPPVPAGVGEFDSDHRTISL